MSIGLTNEDFNRETERKNVDYTTCPFPAHKDKPWSEVPVDYMFWILDNLDLHPKYIAEINKQLDNWNRCSEGHFWHKSEGNYCYDCEEISLRGIAQETNRTDRPD